MSAELSNGFGILIGAISAGTAVGVSSWNAAHTKDRPHGEERLAVALRAGLPAAVGALGTVMAGPAIMDWCTARGAPLLGGAMFGALAGSALIGTAALLSYGVAGI